MTEPTPFPGSGQRDALRARIEAAERRNAERDFAQKAREAATAGADYTRAHPLTVIGGAVAVGLAIGLLTRPGRRVAGQAARSAGDAIAGAASSAGSGARNLAARGGSRLGTLLGEAAVAYVMTLVDDVIESARDGKNRADELGEAAGAQAKKLSANTSRTAVAAVDGTRDIARRTRDAAISAVRDLRRQTKG